MLKVLVNPFFIISSVWLLSASLYMIGLSNQFVFNAYDVLDVLFIVLCPFFAGYFIFFFKSPNRNGRGLLINHKKIKYFFFFWMAVTAIEIIASGGVPFFWYLIGSSKTYFDYGISSIHGLMNSLLLTLSLISFILYLETRDKKFLFYVLFIIGWGVFVIARQMVVVFLIEILFVYLLKKEIHINKRKIIHILSLIVISVCVFGFIGDFRNGREVIINISSLKFDYPDWMPTGPLWVYMYITTPLNNLLNAISYYPQSDGFNIANTISTLLPSALREYFFGINSAFDRGWLYVRSFTVSSAYINPYLDMGKFGIIFFSFIIGFFSSIAWRFTNNGFLFVNAVFLQCLVLSTFVNHFFYLPVIFQLVWYFIITKFCFGKNKAACLS